MRRLFEIDAGSFHKFSRTYYAVAKSYDEAAEMVAVVEQVSVDRLGVVKPVGDCDDAGPNAPANVLLPLGSSPVVSEIAAERRRQIEVEGWTAEHDDQNGDDGLAMAAAAYATSHLEDAGVAASRLWPGSWDLRWWKPRDRRRDLIRAGALIVAEIERLDRSA